MFNLFALALNPLGLMFSILGRLAEGRRQPQPDPLGRQGAAVPDYVRS
jgi:hypothetical protein